MNSANNLLNLIEHNRRAITTAMMINLLNEIENDRDSLNDLMVTRGVSEQVLMDRFDILRQYIENGAIRNWEIYSDVLDDLRIIATSIERVRRRAVIFQIPRFRLTQGNLEDIARALGITIDVAIFLFTYNSIPLLMDFEWSSSESLFQIERESTAQINALFLAISRFPNIAVAGFAVVARQEISSVIGRGISRVWNYVRNRDGNQARPIRRNLLDGITDISLGNASQITQDQDVCSICLDDFTYENPRVRVFACEHAYHLNCINEWRRTNNRCPQCQQAQVIIPPRMYRFSFYSPEPLTINTKEKYTLQLVNKMDKLINMLESPKTSNNVKSFIELTILMIYIKTLVIFKEKYNMNYEETVKLMGL